MFSIVIPLYNKGPYIIRCLNSIYSQSCQEFEIIVIDDGSTDKGAQIVKDQYPKVIVVRQKNRGVSIARNVGIRLSKNPYIAFLDADDAWHPQYLSLVKEVIESNNDVKIIGVHYSHNASVILEPSFSALHYFEIKNYFKIASKNTLFSSSSTVIRKEVILTNNIKFNSSLVGGEDLDFWFRVNLSIGRAFYIKNTLVFYSMEDVMQATRFLPHLSQTLIGTINISYSQYYKYPYFKKFLGQFVLLNLFPYFYRTESHKFAVDVLRGIPNKNILLTIAYKFPLSVGIKVINNLYARKYFRLYLKFIIKASTY